LKKEKIEKENKSNKNKNSKLSQNNIKKLTHIQENIADYEDRIKIMNTFILFVFENIAVYKIRDKNEDIRCWVLDEIGQWINIDPSPQSFFNTKILVIF